MFGYQVLKFGLVTLKNEGVLMSFMRTTYESILKQIAIARATSQDESIKPD